MFRAIKMELYRMFHMKSFYVMLLFLVFITFVSAADTDGIEDLSPKASTETEIGQVDAETLEIGIAVTAPTEPGNRATLLDLLYANASGKAIAIFVVIFTVLFVTADFNSGYIKNIGGQMSSRSTLLFSKIFVLLLYNLIVFGVFLAAQALSSRIILGYVELGDGAVLGKYIGLQLLLHFALSMVCMTVAVLSRSNLLSMILAICLCMNLTVILYSAIDKVLNRLGIVDFHVMNYSVSGRISMLSMNPGSRESVTALVLSVVYLAVAAVCSSLLFEKRDIV